MTFSPESPVLVTGAAGFIGYHFCRRLLDEGCHVVGIDNLSDYYDVQLKRDRLDALRTLKGTFTFHKIGLEDRQGVAAVYARYQFDYVVHLGAQAGVRYSIDHPEAYVDSNLVGFANVLEGCRNGDVKHLVFASSSSVYGMNPDQPFKVEDSVDHPVSLYAATKKSNELMAHSYSHLHDIPTTGLRFFTVYGPWGRPDMAYFLFTRAILEEEPIKVFNHGDMERDFTYVDDIVEGVRRVLEKPARKEISNNRGAGDSALAPFKVYNIGRSKPVDLMRFIEAIESAIGQKAKKEMLPMQPGDVPITYADVSWLQEDVGYTPQVSVEEGVKRFVDWYMEYYNVESVSAGSSR